MKFTLPENPRQQPFQDPPHLYFEAMEQRTLRKAEELGKPRFSFRFPTVWKMSTAFLVLLLGGLFIYQSQNNTNHYQSAELDHLSADERIEYLALHDEGFSLENELTPNISTTALIQAPLQEKEVEHLLSSDDLTDLISEQ